MTVKKNTCRLVKKKNQLDCNTSRGMRFCRQGESGAKCRKRYAKKGKPDKENPRYK